MIRAQGDATRASLAIRERSCRAETGRRADERSAASWGSWMWRTVGSCDLVVVMRWRIDASMRRCLGVCLNHRESAGRRDGPWAARGGGSNRGANDASRECECGALWYRHRLTQRGLADGNSARSESATQAEDSPRQKRRTLRAEEARGRESCSRRKAPRCHGGHVGTLEHRSAPAAASRPVGASPACLASRDDPYSRVVPGPSLSDGTLVGQV